MRSKIRIESGRGMIVVVTGIMEYGSILLAICRDGTGEKSLLHVTCAKSYVQNSALDVARPLALLRDHHWSTKSLNGQIVQILLLSFSQANSIVAEATTMILTRTGGIFSGGIALIVIRIIRVSISQTTNMNT